MRRGLAAAALAIVAALALPASGSANDDLVLGIADQKADTYLDPRVHELELRHARIGVSWNVLEVGYERKRLDR